MSSKHTQTYQIQGLHCGGCVARVSKALSPFGTNVSVTLEPPRVTIEESEASLEMLQDTLSKIGDYTLLPLGVESAVSAKFGLLAKRLFWILGIVVVVLLIGLSR